MKTLNNHVILYDAECPMCRMYTQAFVNSQMLEEGGRTSYQEMPADVCPLVDQQRAVNEIALVNTQTGEVTYGVSSLFKVIAHSFPILKFLFAWRPFIWLISKLYAFISYNRRVIAPPVQPDSFQIQPDFRLKYRLMYLVFTGLTTGYILTNYAHLLAGIVPIGGRYREYLICSGQILFQGIIVAFYAPRNCWNYLGNMMTISAGGALVLLVPLLLSTVFNIPPVVYTAYFLLTAGGMLLEHFRRTRLLGLGWLLSATWILYRALLLIVILKFN